MAWFKKKTEKEVKADNAKIPDYKIFVWEKVAGSRRLVKTFDAMRFVDEDKVPFIMSEENKFMELYPQDVKDLGVKLDDAELKKKITALEEETKKIRNKKIEDYGENEPNIKDLEHNLMVLKAKLRFNYYTEDNNAYTYIDDKGRICIDFLRKGNTFYPLKCDLDTNTIHTASEPVVKKAGILLRNKENKYSPKKLIETAALILLVILIVGILGNLFFGGWLWKKYDDSKLAESERTQLDLQTQCSKIVIENAKLVQDMQDKYKKTLNGTTDIYVQGIIPK